MLGGFLSVVGLVTGIICARATRVSAAELWGRAGHWFVAHRYSGGEPAVWGTSARLVHGAGCHVV